MNAGYAFSEIDTVHSIQNVCKNVLYTYLTISTTCDDIFTQNWYQNEKNIYINKPLNGYASFQ